MKIRCEINECVIYSYSASGEFNNPITTAINRAIILEIDRRFRDGQPHRLHYPRVSGDATKLWFHSLISTESKITGNKMYGWDSLYDPIPLPEALGPLLSAYFSKPFNVVPRDHPTGFDSQSGARLEKNFPQLCFEIDIPDHIITGESP